MNRQIEASVLEKPGTITVQKFPIPDIRDGAILIKPLMCGICGTDKHGFRGEAVQYAGTPREISGPYPAIPGHEFVGRIMSLSSVDCEEPQGFYGSILHEGDRVIISPDVLCGKCYSCRHTYGDTWCDNIRSYAHLDSTIAPHLIGAWRKLMYLFPERDYRLRTSLAFGGTHTLNVSKTSANERIEYVREIASGRGADVVVEYAGVPRNASQRQLSRTTFIRYTPLLIDSMYFRAPRSLASSKRRMSQPRTSLSCWSAITIGKRPEASRRGKALRGKPGTGG
jgi:threonine dehydrogenase-like Zn-dependent dehydrogenase